MKRRTEIGQINMRAGNDQEAGRSNDHRTTIKERGPERIHIHREAVDTATHFTRPLKVATAVVMTKSKKKTLPSHTQAHILP